jgi:selenocysteine lyase/cysteine desulfurase
VSPVYRELLVERDRFEVTKNYTYLNHASRGPLSPPAREIIKTVADEMLTVHPSQIKGMRDGFAQARQSMADLINAPVTSIGLVPNTSSGIAMAAGSLPIERGDNIICAQGEFPANIYPWMNLTFRGVEVRLLDRNPNGISVDQVREAMDERTKVVALSWIGFADGARIDTTAIGGLCAEKKIFFVLDAVQGVGAMRVDLADIDVLVSGSGKWSLSAQGGGFVYLSPMLLENLHSDRVGWLSMTPNCEMDDFSNLVDYKFTLAEDARRVETGSNSLLTQFALGASCRYLYDLGKRKIEERIIALCDYLVTGLRSRGYSITTPVDSPLRSGIVAFRVDEPAATVERLLERKIILSAREGSLRVGLHFYNTTEDIDRLLEEL